MEVRMKIIPRKDRMMSDARARQIVGLVGVLALMSIAQPAFADGTAIETGLTTIKTWLIGISSIVGFIAVVAVGYAKLTGRMDWGRAVTVLIGLGIIFSAGTIVAWMGGSSG